MAILVFRGHPTRGEEIVELLETFGANKVGYTGTFDNFYYWIEGGEITSSNTIPFNSIQFTVEEFLEKFPYKVGDKVLHNLDIVMLIERMYWDSECNIIRYDIVSQVDEKYKLKGLMAEHLRFYPEQKEETMEDKGTLEQIDLTRELRIADEVEVILGDYEFVLKDGKTYFVKKKPVYPKNYKKCCLIVGGIAFERHLQYDTTPSYKFEEDLRDSLETLRKLIICRNAYWKIVGEQMGLGKPWEPTNETVYYISRSNNVIKSSYRGGKSNILEFPTPEIRNAFYENFKDLIEQCKELL